MAKSNSTSRYIVVALALAIAGYGLYLLNNFLKGLQKPTDTPPSVSDNSFDPWGGNYSQTSPTTTNTGGLGVNTEKVLKLGNKGADVKQFQTILNQIADKTKDTKISADGDFGKKTDTLYRKLSANGAVFQPTIKEANRYLLSLSGGNTTSNSSNFFYNPLELATAFKNAINVSWYQNKCAKSGDMCEILKKTFGQGTDFLLAVGREYKQRNDNNLSTDLNTYFNVSQKCSCQTRVNYSFEPQKLESVIAQLKIANL
jgi:hypothetical protein